MCGVQLKDKKRSTYLMFMLGLSETVDQLAMANSVCWYGHVLRRDDGHVLRAIDFEVEGQRKKVWLKRTWQKRVEEESVKVEKARCTLPIEVQCWRKSYCCLIEVNLATLTCWGYYLILNIGVALSKNSISPFQSAISVGKI